MLSHKEALAKELTKARELEHGNDAGLILCIVLGFLLVVVSPIGLFSYLLVMPILSADWERSVFAISSLMFLVVPTYITSRYSRKNRFKYLARCSRSILLPIALGLALLPSTSPEHERLRVVRLMIELRVALELYRFMIRPPKLSTKKGMNQLRIILMGDAMPPKVDGVATFSEHSIELLHKFGHTVRVVTSIKGEDELLGAKVTRFPGMTTPNAAGHSLTLPSPLIFHTFLDFRPHVVHFFEFSMATLFTAVFCQIADIPCTFSHHTRIELPEYLGVVGGGSVPNWFPLGIIYCSERFFFPLIDSHLAVCDILVQRVRASGAGNCCLWASGVCHNFDAKHFDLDVRSHLSQGRPDLPLILHVGRIAPEKNSDDIPSIVKATTRLFGGPDKVRFAIVFYGAMRQEFEREIESYSNVNLVGYLRGEALAKAYASADVFFSPSTTEACPLVYLEAMRSGLAVVGPKAGGVPDMFTNGRHGYSFEPHNSESAAKALKKAIEGGQEMKRLAYAHGKSFTWEKSIRQLEETLLDVVETKRLTQW